MLSAIVQKTTGQTVRDYLTPRLFEPLGIARPTSTASPQGISAGAYGLNVRTEDIAKLGLLYLQRGVWNGKQPLPAGWAGYCDRAADVERVEPDERLGSGLRLPVLAVASRLPRGRRVRSVHARVAGAGRRRGHHERRA